MRSSSMFESRALIDLLIDDETITTNNRNILDVYLDNIKNNWNGWRINLLSRYDLDWRTLLAA